MGSERRKVTRKLAGLRRALGVEVRHYMWNAYRAHCQLKVVLVENVSSIPAIFVEDKAKLPLPQIYPNAVIHIGEFGECAADIVLFFNRVNVTREAAERLLQHPSSQNLPSATVAWAVEGLIRIAEVGIRLLPELKTGIVAEDQRDDDVINNIKSELADWNARRSAFGVS